jgi:phosphate/sulfate permease
MAVEKKHAYRIILGLVLIGLLGFIFTLAFFSFIQPELLKTSTNNNNIIKTQNVCDSSSCLNYGKIISNVYLKLPQIS